MKSLYIIKDKLRLLSHTNIIAEVKSTIHENMINFLVHITEFTIFYGLSLRASYHCILKVDITRSL
jgi:hypothetical protein